MFIISDVKTDEKPVDIWNIDKEKIENDQPLASDQLNSEETKSNIYKTKSVETLKEIKLDENILLNDVKIIGLYDPELNGLKIDMWKNTDGDQLKNIFKS